MCYQRESLDVLYTHFDVTVLETPDQDTAEILADAEVLFAPLGYMVDQKKIDGCSNLRVVASNTTGHPHIDVDYCRQKGIEVACLKFAKDFLERITPTAELSFGLIIAVTRGLIRARESVMSGKWDRRPFGAPKMLSRMKLGVVGLGRLGKKVANYGQAFDMAVRYHDPFVESEALVQSTNLKELATWCEILTIHVPYEKATQNLIGREVIFAMPQGSYLVNTSRGELIDWRALQDALESGHLAGAALDVFEGEFDPGFQERFSNHPLLELARRHENILITPHIGGSTVDAWRETELKTIEMVCRSFGIRMPTMHNT